MEVLIVDKTTDPLRVVGIQPDGKPLADSNTITVNASYATLRIVKHHLGLGDTIFIKGMDATGETKPTNIEIVENKDPVVAAKNLALLDITNLINQNVFQMSIIDTMDFLNSYMRLLNYGIFITDENREDKYFEIIESAQTVEEPEPLKEDSSFEEEQDYIEKKREYDIAQDKLRTLETYLNAYDKLSKVKFVDNLLNKSKEAVIKSSTVEDVESAVREYCDKLNTFMFASPCTT